MAFHKNTNQVVTSSGLFVAMLLFTAASAQSQATQEYPPAQYPQQDQTQTQQQPSYPPAPPQPPAPAYPPPPPPQYGQAQGQYPPAPALAPQQLDQIVAPIALYPDPLLAQVLTAATFSNEIPDAATWAVQHNFLKGDDLAQAIRTDRLPFDPSVQALLAFPQVLDYMARNIGWTQQLGGAVLAERPEVMDAVQRRRQQAYDYGYLRNNAYERVEVPAPYNIEIVPVSPELYYVPVYDPFVIYARPRPGIFIGGAIHFGPAVSLGAAFAPWGWGGIGFGWREHTILVGGRPWDRNWGNRREYLSPYPMGRPRPGVRVERHEVRRFDERHH